MGLFDAMGGVFNKDKTVIQKNIPAPANTGQITGAENLQGEAAGRVSDNDPTQKVLAGASTAAGNMAANGRPGAVMDPQAANNQASGANGNQAGAIELARRQALGLVPSAGVQQLQQGLNQASAQQTSMAAGARGSAALATAGANAAANRSNLQQNAFAGAGMMRSNDMAAGRGMYADLTGQARGQDASALGISNEFGMENAGAADKFALGMGEAAVGFGGVENAEHARDLNNQNTAQGVGYANDDAAQDAQEWLGDSRKQDVAAYLEDN